MGKSHKRKLYMIGGVWCVGDLCAVFQSTSQSNSCAAIALPCGPRYQRDPVTHIQTGHTLHTQTLAHGGLQCRNPCMTRSWKISASVIVLDVPAASNCLSLQYSAIHYPEFLWEMVFGGGSGVRSERMEESLLERGSRGTLRHPPGWDRTGE